MYNYLWYPTILPGLATACCRLCSSGLGGGFGFSCASDLSRGQAPARSLGSGLYDATDCAHLPKKKPVCPNLGTHIQCGVEMYGTHLGCLNFKWWVTPLPISTNVWEESSESDKSIQIIQSGKTVIRMKVHDLRMIKLRSEIQSFFLFSFSSFSSFFSFSCLSCQAFLRSSTDQIPNEFNPPVVAGAVPTDIAGPNSCWWGPPP